MIRRTVQELVSFGLRWSGVGLLIRHTVAQRKASILLYHDPDPETLERHLSFLAPRYNFITLSRLVDAIRDRDWSSIPPRSLVLTFDDAHHRNAELADVLRRHGVIPTIYACSQIVDTDRHYWFMEVDDPEPLKALSNAERLAYLEEAYSFTPTRVYPGRQALTAQEIAGMRDVVEFASHTRFHPVLTTCEADECKTEISLSKTELEALLGTPCKHFSYPNGDYGPREIAYAAEAGYASARSTDLGWNDLGTDPYRLRILGTSDTASINRLAADLSGIAGWLARARQGAFDGRHRGVASA
jgi:peptidoglycan/xylan/chitin deacetylase (PgdA/CDA1 family)